MARKFSLRDFQQDLTRRITEAAAATTTSARLGVQVGDELWLVRLEEAGEVIPVPPITAVPLTRTWFRGLANIRGNLYSVIDFSQFCGGEPVRDGPDARLVLVADRFQMHAALLVSRMLGLRNIQQFAEEQGRPAHAWTAASYRDPDGRSWSELGMGDLVYNNEFLEAGL